ncbi:uncharacterized protein BDZ99DRAFT_548333 [Mytilinidion resinicola]|uniref:Uncharacterized protein n=1 Tax=Mytilinidion resinicola TaxID=574789 RepID=A0A6A6Y2F4_9PEZI|nr:uncharacterized protein BDZ99DRAFT_548333 [Mytilinidion resinicola]KAF2802991.1 hypothetical protein BDZ99DRAFT_548333 [Mytilinidion resinicola]
MAKSSKNTPATSSNVPERSTTTVTSAENRTATWLLGWSPSSWSWNEKVLIMTHQAILWCIYAYLMNVPQEWSPRMEVPLHTLINLTPKAYSTQEERLRADIPAVNTFREKWSGKPLDAPIKSLFCLLSAPIFIPIFLFRITTPTHDSRQHRAQQNLS